MTASTPAILHKPVNNPPYGLQRPSLLYDPAGGHQPTPAADTVRPDHPLRTQLLQVIDEVPGLNINELADRIATSRSTTRHHLAMLVDQGLVSTHRKGNNRFHFSARMSASRQKAIFFLRMASIRSLVESTAQDTTIETASLAEKMGISRRSVRRNLRLLEQQGLLRYRPAARRGIYDIHFHPDLRIAWVLHCRGPARSLMA